MASSCPASVLAAPWLRGSPQRATPAGKRAMASIGTPGSGLAPTPAPLHPSVSQVLLARSNHLHWHFLFIFCAPAHSTQEQGSSKLARCMQRCVRRGILMARALREWQAVHMDEDDEVVFGHGRSKHLGASLSALANSPSPAYVQDSPCLPVSLAASCIFLRSLSALQRKRRRARAAPAR